MAMPTPETSVCTGTGCGKPIRWVLTVEGRRMPLNPDPDPDGNIVAVTLPNGERRARVLAGHDPRDGTETLWVPHWATCPASPQFKRRKARTAARCTACGEPMDPDLARTERWTRHPTCEPPANIRGTVEASRAEKDHTLFDEVTR